MDRRGLEPGYSQKKFFGGSAESGDDAGTTGSLVPVASGRGEPGALRIHQDATICFGRLDAAHGAGGHADRFWAAALALQAADGAPGKAEWHSFGSAAYARPGIW